MKYKKHIFKTTFIIRTTKYKDIFQNNNLEIIN